MKAKTNIRAGSAVWGS